MSTTPKTITILTIGVLSGVFLAWYAYRLRLITNIEKHITRFEAALTALDHELLSGVHLGRKDRENYANQIVHGGVGSIAGPVVTPYPGYPELDRPRWRQ